MQVTEEEFWAAVEGGVAPDRSAAVAELPREDPLPLWLVKNLRELVGLSEDEISPMTPTEARNAWDEWCMQPKPGEPD